jgi:hypothetical protein
LQVVLDLRRRRQTRVVLAAAHLDHDPGNVRTGERKMAQADALVVQAERDRDTGDEAGAHRRIAAINSILQLHRPAQNFDREL